MSGSILARFLGRNVPPLIQAIQNFPSGYSMVISGDTTPPAVLVNTDPTVGIFIRDSGLPVDVLDTESQYAPANTPDGRIGFFVIGQSGVGFKKPFHEQIILQPAPGIGVMRVGFDAIGQQLSIEIEETVS